MSTPKTDGSLILESLAQFYRSMAKAFRSPPPQNSVVIAKLSRVVELHHRAAAAIQAAIELSDIDGREQLLEFRNEETRAAHAVGELVMELGGSPPRPEESSQTLPREPRAMFHARGQVELMAFIREDLDYVKMAHHALVSFSEIPTTMHRRIEALCRR